MFGVGVGGSYSIGDLQGAVGVAHGLLDVPGAVPLCGARPQPLARPAEGRQVDGGHVEVAEQQEGHVEVL